MPNRQPNQNGLPPERGVLRFARQRTVVQFRKASQRRSGVEGTGNEARVRRVTAGAVPRAVAVRGFDGLICESGQVYAVVLATARSV